MKTAIVLADDHQLMRQGLRALLQSQTDFDIVGEASDGLEALVLCRQLKPDLLLLDVAMPSLGGLEVARRLSRQCPRTRILILSTYRSTAYASRALKNGASGYVLKGASAGELIRAIREVVAGRRYLMPPLSEAAIKEYDRESSTDDADTYDSLTAREREVLHMAAEGLSSTEIADRLGISSRTAETHRANLMRKLAIHRRADLVRYALERGLVPFEGRWRSRREPGSRSHDTPD